MRYAGKMLFCFINGNIVTFVNCWLLVLHSPHTLKTGPETDVETSSSVHTAATITTTSSSSAAAAGAGLAGAASTGGKGGTGPAGFGKGAGGSSAAGTPTNMPPLKKKTSVVKQSVPPPVPPRGSPKFNKAGTGSGRGATGSLPSQSSGHRGRGSSAGKRQRRTVATGGHHQRTEGDHLRPQSRSPGMLDTLLEKDPDEPCLVSSPNKVLSWLSSNDFRVSENGDNLSNDEDVAKEDVIKKEPPASAASVKVPKVVAVKRKSPVAENNPSTTNVTDVAKSFERLSSRNGSGSSVQQMIRNFERTATRSVAVTVGRSESMYSRVPSNCSSSKALAVGRNAKPTLPLTIPIIKETLVEDENNNNTSNCAVADEECLRKTQPTVDRSERNEEEDDRLVLANLKNVVKARRELFDHASSPCSTLERVPPASRFIPNGGPTFQGNNTLPKKKDSGPPPKPKQTNPIIQSARPGRRHAVRDQDEIQRRIEEIEAEIRRNEERLNRMPTKQQHDSLEQETDLQRTTALEENHVPVDTGEHHGRPCRNESFLSRLKPKAHRHNLPRQDTLHSSLRQEEKASIIRRIGLPLDENHNLESYLEQFSLEGEFV
ncbi:hypothetical protein ZHAS_00006665 [Anopheles sinensis]|uniref:Uncharacterized protein n=1 Tax=Anopheles sinensis TaxID=74873 RepID=A0A084VMW6_ANOSI|nr:hypothetical protein ZHAS_00006665 [Anopheles sinensis]